MANVDFFFDCSSPWTYLAFDALLEAQSQDGFDIAWHPFLVGAVFNTVNPSVYQMREKPIVPKARYYTKDLHDWIRRSGLAIRWTPSIFPINSARAMRAALVADDAGQCAPYARRIFELYWGEDRDIADPAIIAEALKAAGLDPQAALAEADGEARRAQLKANTEELIARGGFGTPTFYVGDDMYFGQDRLILVREALARQGHQA
ncbi:MAG: 2-hydroxychromene-2-carboxylate isomerase [Polymorphobacter sp.]|uniref:2-hydroxychromene-2-carboxylate isomerase n=1 Tax=Polymorphobacter sp. TaxID=1909290 RepID=UPI003A8B4B80